MWGEMTTSTASPREQNTLKSELPKLPGFSVKHPVRHNPVNHNNARLAPFKPLPHPAFVPGSCGEPVLH